MAETPNVIELDFEQADERFKDGIASLAGHYFSETDKDETHEAKASLVLLSVALDILECPGCFMQLARQMVEISEAFAKDGGRHARH